MNCIGYVFNQLWGHIYVVILLEFTSTIDPVKSLEQWFFQMMRNYPNQNLKLLNLLHLSSIQTNHWPQPSQPLRPSQPASQASHEGDNQGLVRHEPADYLLHIIIPLPFSWKTSQQRCWEMGRWWGRGGEGRAVRRRRRGKGKYERRGRGEEGKAGKGM